MKIIFILPHTIALGILGLSSWAFFEAMMSTNNNGEFGNPELGIYNWMEILTVLMPWFIVWFCLLEVPILSYQFVKYKLKNMNNK